MARALSGLNTVRRGDTLGKEQDFIRKLPLRVFGLADSGIGGCTLVDLFHNFLEKVVVFRETHDIITVVSCLNIRSFLVRFALALMVASVAAPILWFRKRGWLC